MKVYVLRLKDKKELNISPSSGAFNAISDVFLLSGNAVVSAIYNYDTNQNEFSLYTTLEKRNRAHGSKCRQRSPRGEGFWSDYKRKDISFVIKKYTGVSFMSKVKRKIKKIFGGGTLVPVHLYGGQQYASICC